MNPKPKRPIGVTLLSIVFLWIGVGGSLFLPFILQFGAGNDLWRLLLGPKIDSDMWVKAASYGLDGLWYLCYVAYAFIGFGLWKLKNWARKSVLAITALMVVAGLVASLVFVRPALLSFSVLGCTAFYSGWLAWYLLRPRVQYSFGVWRRYTPSGEWIEPPGLSKRWKMGISFLIPTSLIVLFAIPLYFAVNAELRESGAYKLTMYTAQTSPCITSTFGSPLEAGRIFEGSIEESSNEGSANIEIPIKGPRGKGNLDVLAKKANGNWSIESLVFTHGAIRSKLIPFDSSSSCQ